MPYDRTSKLWTDASESFFRDLDISPLRQSGPHCVSTVLAILSRSAPKDFQGRINTQDPVSWSEALYPFGMKLAYCPTDVRKVKFYLPELLELDDLFTVSYFTPTNAQQILADPGPDGWVCGSHIVVLHRGSVLDPASGRRLPARECPGLELHTKRIFRVVPAGYRRGM